VGCTLVQDYIHQPSELNHISLYDWIRSSDVQKNDDIQNDLDDSSDSDEEKMYYCFQKHHPQYHSHHAALVNPNEEWIPNFVGEAIPQSDHGDKENYCSVMLELFKPWQSGKDLKTEQKNWDDAFSEYEFSQRQFEIL
jgi:hypothetical protein